MQLNHNFATLRFFAASLLLTVSPAAIAGQNEGFERKERLSAFREILSGLDRAKLSSVIKATEVFEERFDPRPVDERVGAFLIFRAFYYDLLEEQTRLVRKRHWEDVDNDTDYPVSLRKHGLRLQATEGVYYVGERPNFLIREFGEKVSEAVQAFLRLRSKELADGFSDDGALVISFENVAGRVRSWENYLASYSASPLSEEAMYFYRAYLHTLLGGLDNSPTLKYVGKQHGESVYQVPFQIRKLYREYAKKNSRSESGSAVGEFLSLLEEAQFERSVKINRFLKESYQSLVAVSKVPSWSW
jgi:hypothetical protein